MDKLRVKDINYRSTDEYPQMIESSMGYHYILVNKLDSTDKRALNAYCIEQNRLCRMSATTSTEYVKSLTIIQN